MTDERDDLQFAESTIAVEAYLATDDDAVARRVLRALDNLALAIGYVGPIDEVIRRGSIWRRAKAGLRKGITSDDVKNRLTKIERALELKGIDALQAEVDSKAAAAVVELVGSLQEVPQACIRVGSILLIKFLDEKGPILMVRSLSQPEIRALERFPEIQTKPRYALEALATALVSLEQPVENRSA
jgi:hypothetical protein